MSYNQALAEHYRRIRTDLAYRLHERMADIEVQCESAWYSEPPREVIIERVVGIPGKQLHQVKVELTDLMNRLNKHIDKKKSRY